jgi:hypothetical protein
MPAEADGRGRLRPILLAGAAAGLLDITAAFATWAPKGVSPVRILQGIASGLLGAKSFRGGAAAAALGLAFQFLIATTAAAVFFGASRKLPALARRPFASGALYGIAVYGVMYGIVMPLSRVHRSPFSWTATAIAVLTHVVCVGIPIAVVVGRFSRPPIPAGEAVQSA